MVTVGYTVKWVKGQRIGCLGHLERMEGVRVTKRNGKERDEGEDTGKDGKRK
jgi:hypothetical protein